MTERKQKPEPKVEKETVKDLDPKDKAEDVKGGMQLPDLKQRTRPKIYTV